ncbi:hypothetical protein MTR_7g116800 [Medicago truncatula]|uniref:Uncharacterized protein n=1 Tax=Medicago truncatula TaxID=3880 RepID=G7L314_MEDTR|nr:hypothetical protein MTR_7g116800 [Medicago truncatula]
MELDVSTSFRGGGGSEDADIGFAFNDSHLSDRILILQIEFDAIVDHSNAVESCSTIADWVNKWKRRREDVKKKNENEKDLNTNLFGPLMARYLPPPEVLMIPTYFGFSFNDTNFSHRIFKLMS